MVEGHWRKTATWNNAIPEKMVRFGINVYVRVPTGGIPLF